MSSGFNRPGWPFLLKAGAAAFFALAACGPAPSQRDLVVPFMRALPVEAYDTLKTVYASDFTFLENVYSPLVEYSPRGELVSGLAQRFEWDGGEAKFTMRPGLRTAGGATIDAYDAEFSLKRVFLSGDGKYSFLRDTLCGAGRPASMADNCPGLEVRGSGAQLVMKFGERKTFLFPTLANLHFAVVPRASVDPATLKIINYRETSGPYYVHAQSPDRTIELLPNKYHYHYSPRMPQRALLAPVSDPGNEAILRLLSEGRGDYLLFDMVRYPDMKAAYARANGGFRLHVTYPIRGVYVIFTARGLKRLTLEERLFIGRKLRESFARLHPGYDVPEQIFTMEGGLDKRQLEHIRALNAAVPADGVIRKKLVAWRLFNYLYEEEAAIRK